MKTLLACTALLALQMNTLREKPIVHLPPNQDSIPITFGGDSVQLINAPSVVHLPKSPPTLDNQGNEWAVEVKNMGPRSVEVVGKAHFSVNLGVGQRTHIKSNGVGYASAP